MNTVLVSRNSRYRIGNIRHEMLFEGKRKRERPDRASELTYL
mgnify:CR=1 FL=1